MINGPGNRLVIWTQGCPFCCDGCFNKETHSNEGGYFLTVSALVDIINKDKTIEGITFSGGEPLLFAKEISNVIRRLRKSLTTIVFTGYTPKEILKDDNKKHLVSIVDLTISGRYNKMLKHPFLGKKFLKTSDRIPIDYFKPYLKVEYSINENKVTKTGIFKSI